MIQNVLNWLLTPRLLPTRPLRGVSLRLAQAITALITAAFVSMFLVGLPARYAWLEQFASQAQAVLWWNTHIDIRLVDLLKDIFPTAALTFEAVVMLLYGLDAALLFWKRSHDWMALLTAAGMCGFAMHITPTLLTWMELSPQNTLVGSLFKAVGLALAFLFLYLFPSGSFAPRWMHLFIVAWLGWSILWILYPQSVFGFRDPYTIDIPGFLLLMAWWGVGIASQIYRYLRVSGPLERQQTKTITFGAAGLLLGYLFYVPLREIMLLTPNPRVASVVFHLIAPYIYLVIVGIFPFLITRSILRYRLWDIDLVIRRTLVYTVLTGLLSIFYFGSVALLQGLLTAAGVPSSAAVIVVTTLAIAALFNPLRRRIQDFIDRRFYRQKYDTEKALAEFAAAARSETDLDQLSNHLTNTVRQTLQPEQVSLWLKPGGEH
jgi:hypothetical protein